MTDATTPAAEAARPQVGKVRTADEHADLLVYWLQQIRAQQREVEAAKVPLSDAKAELKDAQDELANRFSTAKVELGRAYSREYLEGLIRDGDAKVRDLVALEKQRATDKTILNQPVFGVQAELFGDDATPTLVRDKFQWEAEGYQRGLRGDVEEIQKGDPPEFHQDIIAGFRNGQAATQERVKRAMERREREGEPDATAKPVDLNGAAEPEPGTPEAKAAERKSIAKAKESLGVVEGGKGKGGKPRRPADADPGEPVNKVPA